MGSRKTNSPVVAYFSMEIAVMPSVPTYAGGLGVLAGDTLRAAADLEVPIVGVTLLHQRRYFYQRLDQDGRQVEDSVAWSIDNFVEPMEPRIVVEIEQRGVQVRAWRFRMASVSGYEIPIFFLDTDLPENQPWDRRITDVLYGGGEHYRLRQEIVLGLGGVRLLRALGYEAIARFHRNEGHAAPPAWFGSTSMRSTSRRP
jgi:glycogen phosphorylase